jgi:Helix-turn-helix domain
MSTQSTSLSDFEKGAVGGGGAAPLLVKPNAAMTMLCVSRAKLYEIINRRQIESFKEGKSRLITVASIHDYIARKLAAEKAAA